MTDSTFTIQQNTVNGLVSTLDGKASVDLSNSPYTTNRILEIPQDIKLELSNGTLTLKAGSKVYVPNGFESDGTTHKFDVVMIDNDIQAAGPLGSFTDKWVFGYRNNGFYWELLSHCFSGSTLPTQTGENRLGYNTTVNKFQTSTGGGDYIDNISSFPICIFSTNSGVISSIDQVFNGFGYIGSTVFALPGVKVQIPDGRNADGTCKSVYGTIRSVQQISENPGNVDFSIRIGDNFIAVSKFVYDEKTNYNYYQTVSPSNIRYQTNAGTVSYSSGKITSFEPFTVDSVVNSNEFYQLKDKAVTTDTAQTISGSKRFTQPSEGMSIELTADTNQQTVPTTGTLRQLGLYRNSTYTKGDGYTSWLQGVRGSDGWSATELYTRRFLEGDSQEIINYLRVCVTPDGLPCSYTRTPPVGVTGEEITTAGWFNTKMQVVSALPAEPDPNVFYFIPE